MTTALLAVAYLSQAGAPEPVLWMKLDGSIHVRQKVVGQAYPAPRLREGTAVVRVPGGLGYDFDGKFSGIMIEDTPSLMLSTPMTVSCWLKLRTYVDRGPGAQILFRGDDRGGLDPYRLVVHPDGNLVFGILNEHNHGAQVAAPIPLEKWIHVVGNADSRAGTITLWMNGERVAGAPLKGIRPMLMLDSAWAPGVGIGNVQNAGGPHNQPLNGTIADLRVYGEVVSPKDAGYGTTGWPVGRD